MQIDQHYLGKSCKHQVQEIIDYLVTSVIMNQRRSSIVKDQLEEEALKEEWLQVQASQH